MIERTYWLKSVGSSDDQQADDWTDSAPNEMTHVRFPDKGKPGVSSGDYLVYYATGHKRIFGIAEVFTPPVRDEGEKRWPWRCDIRPRLIINRIHRSPTLRELNGPERDFHKSVNQQSHIGITEEQYERALRALERVFDAEAGDFLTDWPMFQTQLANNAKTRSYDQK